MGTQVENKVTINIEEHLGLVYFVVNKYVPKNVPVEDSEEYADGCLGLMRATREYDPEKHKTEFSTFATHCIYRSMTQGWRKKNRKRRTANIASIDEKELDLIDHNKDYKKVLEVIEEFLKPHPDDNDSHTRNKWVLKEHFLNDRTWQDISVELGMTRERARQLGSAAISLLRERFELENQNLDDFID